MRNLPDTIKGCVSGPEKHNIMRQCLQHFVSVAHNPKQVLELFSREFYQNKKNKELHLGGTVCIETKSKNGKRLMRRVRVANKPDHLHAYLNRVCQVLNCCPELVNFTRYPLGYCSQTCLSRGKWSFFKFKFFLTALVGTYCPKGLDTNGTEPHARCPPLQ